MSDAWVGVIGVLVGSALTGGLQVYRDWLANKRESELRSKRRVVLMNLLAHEKHSWRKIETLSRVIGCSEEETCHLLIECDARGSTTDSRVWGLIKRNPLEDIEM